MEENLITLEDVLRLATQLEDEIETCQDVKTRTELIKNLSDVIILAETMEKHDCDVQTLLNKNSKFNKVWAKVMDVLKITLPVAVPVIAYDIFQKRLLKFEESGKLTTSAARNLNLPKF